MDTTQEPSMYLFAGLDARDVDTQVYLWNTIQALENRYSSIDLYNDEVDTLIYALYFKYKKMGKVASILRQHERRNEGHAYVNGAYVSDTLYYRNISDSELQNFVRYLVTSSEPTVLFLNVPVSEENTGNCIEEQICLWKELRQLHKRYRSIEACNFTSLHEKIFILYFLSCSLEYIVWCSKTYGIKTPSDEHLHYTYIDYVLRFGDPRDDILRRFVQFVYVNNNNDIFSKARGNYLNSVIPN